MASSFLICRHIVFALFIVYNSVICSVAALNLGLTGNSGRTVQIDAFLIFQSALGLLFIFPLIFIDILRRNALVTRVWFEISWVTLFWIFNLSGASAITALIPQLICSSSIGPTFLHSACSSTTVLVIFTWLSTVTLLAYLLALVIVSILHHNEDSRVWYSGVRDFGWFTASGSIERIKSPPPTPIMPPTMYHDVHRTYPSHARGPSKQLGLPPAYQAEHFRPHHHNAVPPPTMNFVSYSRDTTHTGPSRPPPKQPAPSLYPAPLRSNFPSLPRQPARSDPSPPPPAGNWPRPNPVEPMPRKNRPLAPQTSAATSHAITIPAQPKDATQRATESRPVANNRPKPTGPRGTASAPQRHRPPPLDFSSLNSGRR